MGRSSKWIQFLQGLSQHCPPHTCCFFTPKAVPFSLPVPSLQPPQASPPHTPPPAPPSTSLLATYPGQQQRLGRRERWWHAALGGLPGPQASLPVGWLVWVAAVLRYQIPLRLARNPALLPAQPCRRWAPMAPLLGSSAVGPGGSTRQRASGPEWRETAPCTCGHNSPEGRLLGGGKRPVQGLAPHWPALGRKPKGVRVRGAWCVQVVGPGGGSEPALCSSLALGKAHLLSEPPRPHFLALESRS